MLPNNQERECPMASITIRNLDDEVKTRLRVRDTRHRRSMEEEARMRAPSDFS